MHTDPVELIQNARFRPVRLSEGYDMGEVDYLLDRLVAAAERGEPLGPVIDGTELGEVRLREGYSIEDVDALLAVLRDPSLAVPPVAEPPSAPQEPEFLAPPVIVEQRGFLARLFGRR